MSRPQCTTVAYMIGADISFIEKSASIQPISWRYECIHHQHFARGALMNAVMQSGGGRDAALNASAQAVGEMYARVINCGIHNVIYSLLILDTELIRLRLPVSGQYQSLN